jgi:hypothetical protein
MSEVTIPESDLWLSKCSSKVLIMPRVDSKSVRQSSCMLYKTLREFVSEEGLHVTFANSSVLNV